MEDENTLAAVSVLGAEIRRLQSEVAFYMAEAERLKRMLDNATPALRGEANA